MLEDMNISAKESAQFFFLIKGRENASAGMCKWFNCQLQTSL